MARVDYQRLLLNRPACSAAFDTDPFFTAGQHIQSRIRLVSDRVPRPVDELFFDFV